MKAKDILENVFAVTFPQGKYVGRIQELDRQNHIGMAQFLLILGKLCEALDQVDADLQAYKEAHVSTTATTSPQSGAGVNL